MDDRRELHMFAFSLIWPPMLGTSPFRWAAAAALCLTAAGQPSQADEIDRYIAQEQRLYGLPAVVVGVIRDGRLVEKRANGLVNVELGVRATTEHVFEIGSISKQFTAYAILASVRLP